MRKVIADIAERGGPLAPTRVLVIGALGVMAVALGSAFLGFQKGAWVGLGALYLALGMLYATGPRLLLHNGIGIPVAATGLVYPLWAMVAMAVSVTAICFNSLWGRPALFINAILSVGRTPIAPVPQR